MMLASCASSDDGLQAGQKSPTEQVSADGSFPVGFSAYADRGTTRGGKTGSMDLEALRSTTGAFGVFAYYTDLKKYDQTYVPNIMYNQRVYDDNVGVGDATWTYTPIVYWPNESGSDASSDDEDKMSFFAYAPYVKHGSAAAGSVDTSADPTAASWGITGFSRNSAVGDPLVKYISNFSTANTVDLCWGVCNEQNWAKIQNSGLQTMTPGLPWLDVEHPQTTSQKMKFTFKHALAQLNVQIDADVDITGHATNDALDASTKIYVRSISFTGIATKGALNLNNNVANQALWLDYAGTTDLPYGESVTIKDGRRDGREGTIGAEATNETPAGLNPAIIQNDANNPTIGVTTTYQNLFAPAVAAAIPGQPTADEITTALTNPVYVIPTGEAMTVTIVYDVETESPLLPGYLSDGVTHGSSIENKITQNIYLSGSGLSLESGKKYTLYLHLGMNSVKFDAAVDDWDNSSVSGTGWLPENVSAVRIMKEGNQITHATMSTSDATLALTGDVHPTAADPNQTLEWRSSDEGVATVADGTVTAVADGECTITATSTATGKSATINLLVTHKYSDVVAGDVRRIIAANGYIYDNTTQAAEYGTNGVGIICYAGAAGTADESTTYDASAFKALGWALTDVNESAGFAWNDEETDCEGITYVGGVIATARQEMRGIDLTNIYINDGHNHDAAKAAHNYAVDITGFTNSGWFLPTIGQWNLMLKSLMNGTTYEDGDNRADSTYDVADYTEDIPNFAGQGTDRYRHYAQVPVNKVIEPLGATGVQYRWYWSSTAPWKGGMYCMDFSRGYWGRTNIYSLMKVRPVFAF